MPWTFPVLFFLIQGQLQSQDLFDRARQERFKERLATKEKNALFDPLRTDLLGTPEIFPSTSKTSSPKTAFGFERAEPDYACTRFDLKTTLSGLFERAASDEFFDTNSDSVSGSRIYTTCLASPTACDAMKHYSYIAAMVAALRYRQCETIERGAEDLARKVYARSIKECIDGRARGGEDLDKAMEACLQGNQIRTPNGDLKSEVTFTDLTQGLSLEEGDQELVERFLGELHLSGKGLRGHLPPDVVGTEFNRLKEEYRERWKSALEGSANGDPATGLTPAGTTIVTPRQVREIASLDPGPRELAADGLASNAALMDVLGRVHRVEEILETLEVMSPLDKHLREELTVRRQALRNQLTRLIERQDLQGRAGRQLVAVWARGHNEGLSDATALSNSIRHSQSLENLKGAGESWGMSESLGKGKDKILQSIDKRWKDCDPCKQGWHHSSPNPLP